jgi:hypothetical protein
MNKLCTVEMLEQGLWRIIARTDDNLFSAEAVLDVKTPALDIRSATLSVTRDEFGLVPDLSESAQKLIGVRVGPGMTKIVRGVLGGEAGSERMAQLVLEAMEMLINAMTVPQLRQATVSGGIDTQFDNDGPKIFLNNRVIGEGMAQQMAENPRLKDSCVAFKDVS